MASIRMETIADVRPEDGGPEISVIAPRGSPPVSTSRGAIPVGTLSRTRRSRSVNGDGIRSAKADSNRARVAERERDSAKPSVRMTDCIKKTGNGTQEAQEAQEILCFLCLLCSFFSYFYTEQLYGTSNYAKTQSTDSCSLDSAESDDSQIASGCKHLPGLRFVEDRHANRFW